MKICLYLCDSFAYHLLLWTLTALRRGSDGATIAFFGISSYTYVLVIARSGSLLNTRSFGPIKCWGTIFANIDQQKAKHFEDWLTKQNSSKLKNRNMKINPDMVFLRFCILTKTRWLLTIVTPSWMSFLTSLNELTVSIVYLFQLDFCNDDSAWQAIPKSAAIFYSCLQVTFACLWVGLVSASHICDWLQAVG